MDSKTVTERLREMLEERGVRFYAQEIDKTADLIATLGSGECECVWNEQKSTFHCSSCDTLLTSEVRIEWPSYKVMPITLPNYCPNCGRKVKR